MRCFKNTVDQYGVISILLHWVIAILILAQIALGWYMMEFATGDAKSELIDLHKSIGLFILMAVAVRILWRSSNITPSIKHLARFEQVIAHSLYGIIYLLMLAIPITGWLMSSAHGYSVSFFELFTLPSIVSPNKELGDILETCHNWCAYGLLGIVVLHVAAALKHHFINKDNILRRMFF